MRLRIRVGHVVAVTVTSMYPLATLCEQHPELEIPKGALLAELSELVGPMPAASPSERRSLARGALMWSRAGTRLVGPCAHRHGSAFTRQQRALLVLPAKADPTCLRR